MGREQLSSGQNGCGPLEDAALGQNLVGVEGDKGLRGAPEGMIVRPRRLSITAQDDLARLDVDARGLCTGWEVRKRGRCRMIERAEERPVALPRLMLVQSASWLWHKGVPALFSRVEVGIVAETRGAGKVNLHVLSDSMPNWERRPACPDSPGCSRSSRAH